MDRRTFITSALATVAVASCSNDKTATSSAPPVPAGSAPTTAGAGTAVPSTTAAGTTAPVTTSPITTVPPSTVPVNPTAALPGPVFTLGVASGDPTDSSVILWTRLAPKPVDDGGMPNETYFVRYDVARDEAMTDIVVSGFAEAVPDLAHSVHVDVQRLDADSRYWYRFALDDELSPVGRTRTMPTSGGESLKFVFGSCQEFEAGYYAAWRHATADDPDVVIFLGDYIYEGSGEGAAPERAPSLVGADDLASYRNRYASYKVDLDLQGAHAIAPWLMTWDDHEVENDYANDVSETDRTPEQLRTRRADGYQAWYEHQPVRLAPPTGPDYKIYRSIKFGDLVEVFMLDGRQYRSAKPCFTDTNAAGSFLKGLVKLCDEAYEPGRTLLGDEQEAWLIDGLTKSTATWKILGNDVFMFGANVTVGVSPPTVITDTWDGFPEARQRLLGAISDNKIDNVVVLTGDFHAAAIADVRADPFDLTLPVVASEFMATSISSEFPDAFVALASAVVAQNKHVHFFDTKKGYGRCTVDANQFLAEARALSDVKDPKATCSTLATYKVVSGTPGFVPA
jgi:alkaline phosphatase D